MGATIASLGPSQPAAEWKAPSEEEQKVIASIAESRGLEFSVTGSGKKRRCRVELSAELVQAQGAAGCTEAPTGAGYPAASSGDKSSAPNASLAELHAERTKRQEEAARRQAAAAEERRAQNEA